MMRRATLFLPALVVWACADSAGPGLTGIEGQDSVPRDTVPSDTTPPVPDVVDTIAFIGNSLTFTNDIPGLVQAMADADGRPLTHVTLVMPASSLEDHWYAGDPDVLRQLRADRVLLQQGPSTLPANREHLIYWTRQFTEVIRQAGGEPALFMIWPSVGRIEYFPEVWTSYKAAADSVGGVFIPAGQTWVEAWEIDPSLELYGFDGVHPSYLGSLAAAQTIYARLFDLPADSVPALDDGVDEATRAVLRAALEESLRLAAGSGDG